MVCLSPVRPWEAADEVATGRHVPLPEPEKMAAPTAQRRSVWPARRSPTRRSPDMPLDREGTGSQTAMALRMGGQILLKCLNSTKKQHWDKRETIHLVQPNTKQLKLEFNAIQPVYCVTHFVAFQK